MCFKPWYIKDTTKRLLLRGWKLQHSTSAPLGSMKVLIQVPFATSHKQLVPSSDDDRMMSFERDQAKSEKHKHLSHFTLVSNLYSRVG